MPSEQADGDPQLCSDIYAVGIIGIQALTGLRPLELRKDSQSELVWRNKAKVSPELANILDQMVRRNFKERYLSAVEAWQAIQSLRTSE
jgi:serine/threonine-protein kinase